MELKRVVVTGLGTVNPLGNSIPEYFKGLAEGACGAGLIDRFDVSLFKTKFACEVKNFNPADFGIDRKEARKMDRFTQYAMASATQAIEDCGIDLEKADKRRIGVIIGSGIGGIESLTTEVIEFAENGRVPRFNPFLIPKMIPDIAAGSISIKYGFMGPNYATVSACASSAHAISDALTHIRLGKADMIVTGGSEACVTIPSVGGFNSAQALSTNNDEYMTASRPFDRTRDGFVLGEGAAVLVLEEYEHAKARGAKIYAEIAGYGATCDAFHMTSPDPAGEAAAAAIKLAYEEAGLAPEDIDYINAHGTSTHLNDLCETTAIKLALGDAARNVVVNSTKSMTGHLLGAAGAVEAIVTALSCKEDFVHKTVGFKVPDPECDLDNCTDGNRNMTVNAALTNNLGFGGHNATLCFKKYAE